MGISLSSHAEWSETRDREHRILIFSDVNNFIIESYTSFIGPYVAKNPYVSALPFVGQTSWSSLLKFRDLKNFDFYKNCATSRELDKDGKPVAVLEQVSNEEFKATARTFGALNNFLNSAGDFKLAEMKRFLEENINIYEKICGKEVNIKRWSFDELKLFKIAEDLKRALNNQRTASIREKGLIKLVVDLHNYDIQLRREICGMKNRRVPLSALYIETEYDLMRMLVDGKCEKNPLIEIRETDPYTVKRSNGYRAPPWREVLGEVAYFLITVEGHENVLSITASNRGWFINRGFDSVKCELSFDQEGEVYPTLLALLRSECSAFEEFLSAPEGVLLMYRLKWLYRIEKSTRKSLTELRQEGAERKLDGNNLSRDVYENPTPRQTSGVALHGVEKCERSASKPRTDVISQMRIRLCSGERNLTSPSTSVAKPSGDQMQKRAPETDVDSIGEPSSDSEEEGQAQNFFVKDPNTELPPEHWQIGKLVKYIKGGNQTSTTISLCALYDMPLNTEVCQLAVRDTGGVEVLVNLLETDEVRCKLGALKILKEISQNPELRRAISDQGGIPPMVELLRSPNRDLKCLSAEAIANVAKFARARRTVRQQGGIKKLVALLDVTNYCGDVRSPDVGRDLEVARCGALALWSCSKSVRARAAMKKAGVISLLARLLKSPYEALLIPTIGILEECASEHDYRDAIRTEGMVEDLVAHLRVQNEELQMHCATTIFKCAVEQETRDLVRQHGGLLPLLELLSVNENKELQAATTGAIWKCAISPENAKELQKGDVISKLVAILTQQPEEVLVNVVGALGEMAKNKNNIALIRQANGIPPLIALLTGTNEDLLINTTRALGRIAEDQESAPVIEKYDGVRLLWSLMKSNNPSVQANAAWALCPCIENAVEGGEMVRSFVGGLELVIGLLRSPSMEVRAAICGVISKIAKDEENLAVITDHGAVPLLSELSYTTEDSLRRPLAEAVARCCCWATNRSDFGKNGAVEPLVCYLKSEDPDVQCATAKALHQLSKHPENCVVMHAAGAVKYLVDLVSSNNEELQEAASSCIANIRRIALAHVRAQQEWQARETRQQFIRHAEVPARPSPGPRTSTISPTTATLKTA